MLRVQPRSLNNHSILFFTLSYTLVPFLYVVRILTKIEVFSFYSFIKLLIFGILVFIIYGMSFFLVYSWAKRKWIYSVLGFFIFAGISFVLAWLPVASISAYVKVGEYFRDSQEINIFWIDYAGWIALVVFSLSQLILFCFFLILQVLRGKG